MAELVESPHVLRLGHCRVDLFSGQVTYDSGEADRLSERERELLVYLAGRPEQVVSREALYREVWSYHQDVLSRAVDNCVRRLRRRIEPQPSAPVHILTVHGQGYRFEPPRTAAVASPGTGTARTQRLLGRAPQLQRLSALLAAPGLVSVVGPAGMGKTLLAQTWAAQAAGQVVACDLSVVDDRDGLARVVARALGVRLSGDRDLQLSAALARRGPAVLLLDNFEQHIAHGAPIVARWLAAAPALRVLLTSRQRLGLAGEQVLWLSRLSTGDGGALLQERCGRLGAPAGAADAREVAELLGGVPLAIEMIAARVGVLSLRELADRLREDAVLPLLQGPRGAPRHASMQQALAQSWSLLAPWEQSALRQLVVFVGGFTARSAEAVCDLRPWPEAPPVLDVLTALRDKSFLRPDAGPGGAGRLHLYMMAAEFVRDQGTPPDAQQRLWRWAADQAEHWPLDPDRPEPLRRLRPELENLLAAADGALSDGALPLAARAGLAAVDLMRIEGMLGEACERGQALLSQLPPADPTRRALSWTVSNVLLLSGQIAECRAVLSGSVRDDDDDLTSALLRVMLAGTERSAGAPDPGALRRLQRAHDIFGESDSPHLQALALNSMAKIVIREDMVAAEQHHRRGLAIAGHHRAAFLTACIHEDLGSLLEQSGRNEEARSHIEAAAEGFRSFGARYRQGTAKTALGLSLDRAGLGEQAQAAFESALQIHRDVGNLHYECATLCFLSAHAPLPRAAELVEEAHYLAEQIGSAVHLGRCHRARAGIAKRSGDLGRARRSIDEALRFCDSMPIRRQRYLDFRASLG